LGVLAFVHWVYPRLRAHLDRHGLLSIHADGRVNLATPSEAGKPFLALAHFFKRITQSMHFFIRTTQSMHGWKSHRGLLPDVPNEALLFCISRMYLLFLILMNGRMTPP
jgi:hypothetical protein